MISPRTPAGTKIVCIDVDGLGPGAHLVKDAVYIVATIGPAHQWDTGEYGLGVFVVGGDERICYNLWRFRYLELPKSITLLLKSAPTPVPENA